MVDALLVADQSPQHDLLTDMFPSSTDQGRVGAVEIAIDTHLSDGRRVLQGLNRSRLRTAKLHRFRDSMNWLTQNRAKYRGQWIALDGETLLAVGASAKDVFAEVGRLSPVPMVIQVEDDEMPFAGW